MDPRLALLPLALPLLLAAQAKATSPIAEVVCAPKDEIASRLETRFGQSRQSLGLRDPETVMELWTSERNASWTLVLAYADGRSCIVAMGEDWTEMAPSHS